MFHKRRTPLAGIFLLIAVAGLLLLGITGLGWTPEYTYVPVVVTDPVTYTSYSQPWYQADNHDSEPIAVVVAPVLDPLGNVVASNNQSASNVNTNVNANNYLIISGDGAVTTATGST